MPIPAGAEPPATAGRDLRFPQSPGTEEGRQYNRAAAAEATHTAARVLLRMLPSVGASFLASVGALARRGPGGHVGLTPRRSPLPKVGGTPPPQFPSRSRARDRISLFSF